MAIDEKVVEVKPGVSLDEVEEDDFLILNGKKGKVVFCARKVNQPAFGFALAFREGEDFVTRYLSRYDQDSGRFLEDKYKGIVDRKSLSYKELQEDYSEGRFENG